MHVKSSWLQHTNPSCLQAQAGNSAVIASTEAEVGTTFVWLHLRTSPVPVTAGPPCCMSSSVLAQCLSMCHPWNTGRRSGYRNIFTLDIEQNKGREAQGNHIPFISPFLHGNYMFSSPASTFSLFFFSSFVAKFNFAPIAVQVCTLQGVWGLFLVS